MQYNADIKTHLTSVGHPGRDDVLVESQLSESGVKYYTSFIIEILFSIMLRDEIIQDSGENFISPNIFAFSQESLNGDLIPGLILTGDCDLPLLHMVHSGLRTPQYSGPEIPS